VKHLESIDIQNVRIGRCARNSSRVFNADYVNASEPDAPRLATFSCRSAAHLITHHSSLITHYSLLITHYSLFITSAYCSPLTGFASSSFLSRSRRSQQERENNAGRKSTDVGHVSHAAGLGTSAD
jgi:hypothetical protein